MWCNLIYTSDGQKLESWINLRRGSSVQFSRSVVSDSWRPHEPQHARPPCPSLTPGVHSRLTSIESVMPSSHLILCRPLLLPPIPPSIKVFSNESTLWMRWPKYWSFSFSIIPSKEIPGLMGATKKTLSNLFNSLVGILYQALCPDFLSSYYCSLAQINLEDAF